MKVARLKELIANLDDDNTIYLDVDDKLIDIDCVAVGQFYKSNIIKSRVEFDIIRAEKTLISLLQFQPEEMKDEIKQKIERAIGSERVEFIKLAIEDHKKKLEKEKEENKELIEEIQEKINSDTGFEDETEEEELTEEKAEQMLTSFYSGAKLDVSAVKKAKHLLGDQKAEEIFKKVRNK